MSISHDYCVEGERVVDGRNAKHTMKSCLARRMPHVDWLHTAVVDVTNSATIDGTRVPHFTHFRGTEQLHVHISFASAHSMRSYQQVYQIDYRHSIAHANAIHIDLSIMLNFISGLATSIAVNDESFGIDVGDKVVKLARYREQLG